MVLYESFFATLSLVIVPYFEKRRKMKEIENPKLSMSQNEEIEVLERVLGSYLFIYRIFRRISRPGV